MTATPLLLVPINQLETSLPILLGYGALIGLVVGSFIGMLSWRMPKLIDADSIGWFKGLTMGRSYCDACHTPLKARQLVPVFSWFWTQGKASCCGQTIAWRYPAIELSTSLLTLLTLWFGYEQHHTLIWLLLALGFTWSLLLISIMDLEHGLILDRISLPLMWFGILLHSSDWGWIALEQSVWGAALGYLSLWSIYQIHHAITGKEGMGYGDFKLLAALGAWLGWQALIPIMMLSGILGIVFALIAYGMGNKTLANRIPFAPWLALAGWLVLIEVYRLWLT